MMGHKDLYDQACQFFPGGVNSPVRSFQDAGQPHPLFIRSAYKSFVIDEKNRCFLDFVGSWGPMIHGHAHPKILESVQETLKKGLSFGAPTKKETELAVRIQKFFPKIEKMRFTSSGTEAAMTAVRIARAATQKEIIVKFEGCYHGHSDSLLIKIGSAGAKNQEALTSDGVLSDVAQKTHVLPFNDLDSLRHYFTRFGTKIAAVIIEPIAGNMGCIPAHADFLSAISQLCAEHGALVIADEIMTGFRVAPGGASSLYPDFHPDLYLLGKIVGGGLPLAVVGGKKEYIDLLAPAGDVYHAGTLSGNPIAVQAGLTTLELLEKKDFHKTLQEKTQFFCQKLGAALSAAGLEHSFWIYPGMFSIFQTAQPPLSFEDVRNQSQEHFQIFFQMLLRKDIYWPPSMFEACFISQAHTFEQLEKAASDVAYAWIYATKMTQKASFTEGLLKQSLLENEESMVNV